MLVRCIPFLEHGKVTGAVVLTRDVSDLRRRDAMLISKDATIREIHHRVKNNLQTISSLLRMHSRRVESPDARAALEESVRRVRSIALVHETLSTGATQDVDFIQIVKPLVRMVEEGLQSDERPVRLEVKGDAGELRAEIATPLAVVLTELLQNAVQHGYPTGEWRIRATTSRGTRTRKRPPGRVVVSFANDGSELVVQVRDDGVGLPAGFTLERPNPNLDRPTLGPDDRADAGDHRAGGHDRDAHRRRDPRRAADAGQRRHPHRLTAYDAVTAHRLTTERPDMVGLRTYEARRLRASQALRIRRRSSSDVAPQTPDSWFVARANSRHSSLASHCRHTILAASIWSRAGPVVPIGKNRSGSVSRHDARVRQSSRSQSWERLQVRATTPPPCDLLHKRPRAESQRFVHVCPQAGPYRGYPGVTRGTTIRRALGSWLTRSSSTSPR